MRALFLLLLLANLLFLAWATWISPPAPLAGQATPSAPDRKAIRLLREAREAEPAAAAAGAAATADLQAAACVSLGPFLTPAQAEAAGARLTRLGFTYRTRAATDEVRVGLWVRVADLATPEDAATALAALRTAGLADAEAVTDETAGNLISLGVFAEPERAAAVAERARQAGYATETSDRTRAADVSWLDVDRQANGGLPALDATGIEAGAGEPPLELRACPAAEAPAG